MSSIAVYILFGFFLLANSYRALSHRTFAIVSIWWNEPISMIWDLVAIDGDEDGRIRASSSHKETETTGNDRRSSCCRHSCFEFHGWQGQVHKVSCCGSCRRGRRNTWRYLYNRKKEKLIKTHSHLSNACWFDDSNIFCPAYLASRGPFLKTLWYLPPLHSSIFPSSASPFFINLAGKYLFWHQLFW